MNLNLDFSFYNWELISNYVLKGFYFSVTLTVVATLGGILLGTVLALMRLSGKRWLAAPAVIYVNGMQSGAWARRWPVCQAPSWAFK